MYLKKDQMLCPHCHRIMRKDYSYCPTCGQFVQEIDSEISIKSLLIRLLGFTAILCLLIGLLIWVKLMH